MLPLLLNITCFQVSDRCYFEFILRGWHITEANPLQQDDIANLDLTNGECYNKSIPQNVTYGWQGRPFARNP